MTGSSSQKSTDLEGWTIDSEIDIVRGNLHNHNLKSWVVRLDANNENCIQQTVNLKKGYMILTFLLAIKADKSYRIPKFVVKLNGIK